MYPVKVLKGRHRDWVEAQENVSRQERDKVGFAKEMRLELIADAMNVWWM